jgi:putative oxidoreductase
MKFLHTSRLYGIWAPFIARLFFGFQFLLGAAFKIPGTTGFAMEVTQTASAGVPFANVAVFLAFVLEVLGGLMLIVGFRARLAAFLLAGFTAILAFVFYRGGFGVLVTLISGGVVSDPSDYMTMGMFVSHLAFIAGLLFVSVYGAKSLALKRD